MLFPSPTTGRPTKINIHLFCFIQEWIQPICLPNVVYLKKATNYIGAQFVTSGWIESEPQKTFKKFITDTNKVCEFVKNYDPYYHLCVNNTVVSQKYGPIMSVDTSNRDKPFWFIYGFFIRRDSRPRIGTKVGPYLDWIFTVINETMKQ